MPLGFALTLPAYRPGPSLSRQAGEGGARRASGGRVRAALAALLFLAAGPAWADEATETRLRDALRQAITQQRSLEDSSAQLQAKVSDQDKLIAALKAQLDQKKPAAGPAVDRAEAERMAAEFNRRLAAENEQARQMGETLEKWKAAYNQAAEVARAREAERARLAGAVEGLTKRGETCEAKNALLFKVGNEILDRLKDVDVAEAIAAHEPFVGTKRVELQSLAQDFQDKLLDQRAGP
ncbi:hypothetical protein [Telmatospirillum siberiense]|nr:hypothetical protein [Telmatospirillum siberiense]